MVKNAGNFKRVSTPRPNRNSASAPHRPWSPPKTDLGPVASNGVVIVDDTQNLASTFGHPSITVVDNKVIVTEEFEVVEGSMALVLFPLPFGMDDMAEGAEYRTHEAPAFDVEHEVENPPGSMVAFYAKISGVSDFGSDPYISVGGYGQSRESWAQLQQDVAGMNGTIEEAGFALSLVFQYGAGPYVPNTYTAPHPLPTPKVYAGEPQVK